MNNGGAQACPPIPLKPQSPAILLLTDRSSNTTNADGQGRNWWKGENDAINAALDAAPSSVKFGYRPFPVNPGCGGGDSWNDTWMGMVGDRITACMTGSCVSQSPEIPLSSVVDNVGRNDTSLQGLGDKWKPWLVVLLGTPPSCGVNACQSVATSLTNLSRYSRMSEAIVPFGGIAASDCLDNLQAITSSVAPSKTAQTSDELKTNLVETITGIVAQTQCTFVSGAFAQSNNVDSLRVQIGGPSGTTLPDLTNSGATKAWADDGYSFEILGGACRTISEALAKGQTVSVVAFLSSSCRGNP